MERFFLLFYEICGQQVRRNFHQSGCSKVQVKISRQIARVETEPVIHHAGHAPVNKREIQRENISRSAATAMVHAVCFSSYAQFGVCEPQRTNYYVLLAQEHLLRKLEKKNPQTFVRCGCAG